MHLPAKVEMVASLFIERSSFHWVDPMEAAAVAAEMSFSSSIPALQRS
jgi:hypothetical protein